MTERKSWWEQLVDWRADLLFRGVMMGWSLPELTHKSCIRDRKKHVCCGSGFVEVSNVNKKLS